MATPNRQKPPFFSNTPHEIPGFLCHTKGYETRDKANSSRGDSTEAVSPKVRWLKLANIPWCLLPDVRSSRIWKRITDVSGSTFTEVSSTFSVFSASSGLATSSCTPRPFTSHTLLFDLPEAKQIDVNSSWADDVETCHEVTCHHGNRSDRPE